MSLSKMIMGQSGNQGSGAPTNIENLFAVNSYTGTASEKQITNNIDISTNGGMVIIKNMQGSGTSHNLFDTARGRAARIATNLSSEEFTSSSTQDFKSFNSDGFTLNATAFNTNINVNNQKYNAITFRKAENFFDIVTYTGNNTSGRTIAHNLGVSPAMIWVKKRNTSEDWSVWSKHLHTNSSGKTTQFLRLSSTAAAFPSSPNSSSSATSDIQAANAATFTIGNDARVNGDTDTYVAYLFASHDGNTGTFGDSGNQDIIKIGTYTGNQSNGKEIDVGFEPQYLMLKNLDSADDWFTFDYKRGISFDHNDTFLQLNDNNGENNSINALELTPSGFTLTNNTLGNENNDDYIYMAIRRSMPTPTSSSEVFGVVAPNNTEPLFQYSFEPDFIFYKTTDASNNASAAARLTDRRYFSAIPTDVALSTSSVFQWDYDNGVFETTSNNSDVLGYAWKRANTYFDVRTYHGTGSATTVSHSLGAVPEMIWIKQTNGTNAWQVYHSGLGNTKRLRLSTDNQPNTGVNYFNNTDPTSTVFSIGSDNGMNDGSGEYIAFLFATVAGVSKVGSFTGNGSSQTIDCGFSNGCKLFILKGTSGNCPWYVFDSHRGIVSGNDKWWTLNTANAQNTTTDYVDPVNSGIIVNHSIADDINVQDNHYIFYAVAA